MTEASQFHQYYTSQDMDIPAADCFSQTLGWPTVELVLFIRLVGWQALLSVHN
jgi:hypothetical protein